MTDTTTDPARWQQVKELLAQALDLAPEERPRFLDLACGGDRSLRAEIDSLLAFSQDAYERAHSLPPVWTAEAAQSAGRNWIGRRLGPWCIVARIGGGGMGEVYRAERVDGQFAQEVAIKVMREGFNPEGLAARFKAERQILASLDHPNLAKVLDGGISEDGLPYFVMELVDGEPIDVHVARRKLSVEERVRLFRSVCQVVHYAHQKRVVHRDLKADNILVRHDGVVKLVDFGIAKRIDDPGVAGEQTRTATAQRAMTLVYSSPEQVRGGEITLASDIYSLGVVLYRLLASVSPYPAAATESPYELTRAICDIEPVPPSVAASTEPETVRRRLRGDLDAVVMMALRKDPSHRYASAEAMSEDLFRHLEGLPVQARRGAWSYRAGRFLLRNRALVGAVMAANLALVAGIAVAGYEAWQANQQRARAEHDFAGMHQLAGVFVFDIHDAIQNLPGSTSARRLVVQTALKYLQDSSAEAAEDPALDRALRAEIGAGYRKVGDILGRPHVPNLGDPKGAYENYERARAQLEPLVAGTALTSTESRVARRELALTLQREGALLDAMGKYKEAEATITQALALQRPLAEPPDASKGDQLALANAITLLSTVQFDQSHLPDYLKTSDQALALLQALLAKSPDDREILQAQSAARDLRGQYLSQADDSPAGRQATVTAFQQSAEALARIHALEPDRADVTRKLAGSLSNVGAALSYAGDLKGAAVKLRQAITLLAGLAARDPLDMDSRGTQALVTTNLADLLREIHEYDDAVRNGNDAIAIFGRMADGTRLDASMRSAVGTAHYVLAKSLTERAIAHPNGAGPAALDRAEGCREYNIALDHLRKLKASSGIIPGNLDPDAAIKEMQDKRCPVRAPSPAASMAA